MAKKLSDAEQVAAYMTQLEHPMKAEIEQLREIIRSASPLIQERIKWNAPSYYYKEDILTFGPPARKAGELLLVFHHPTIVAMECSYLEGNYKDRRLMTLRSADEIEARAADIVRILQETTEIIANC